jgi:hypothetical protein
VHRRLVNGFECIRGLWVVIIRPPVISFEVRVVEQDFLLAISQVSVGLAGFSAIVGLLGSRSGRSDLRVDALRMQVMLETSLMVAAYAFLPVLVSSFDFEVWTTWRISSAGFLIVAIPYEFVAMRRTKDMPDMRLNRLNVNTINWALSFTADAIMLVVLIGLFGSRASALYLLAISFLLVLAGTLFVQFASSTFVPADQ